MRTHQCRFAGAVRTDDGDRLVALDGERHVVQHRDAAVARFDVLDAQHGQTPR